MVCFFLLGWTVYSDDPARDAAAFAELSPLGRQGRALWREQNCNACHQLYGFGGYLGPDLTHVAQRVTEEDFEHILRAGVGVMPRIAVDDADKRAIYAFLREMDRTGQGHPPANSAGRTWAEVFAALGPGGAPGAAIFRSRACDECHQPMKLGRLASPDLTRVYERAGPLEIENTLRRGRRNMPPYSSLNRAEMEQVLEMLRLLGEHRAALLKTGTPAPALPWFNYQPRGDR